MKALPVKLIHGQGYVPVEDKADATHVTLNIPGPSGKLTLPVILHGTREGTGCWTWNGDTDNPTLKPSVLNTSGHFNEKHNGECWCDYNRNHPDNPSDFQCFRCHSWINDGHAQFLEDCSHEFKGQTVPLPEVKI